MDLPARTHSAGYDGDLVVSWPPLCIIAKFDEAATDVRAPDGRQRIDWCIAQKAPQDCRFLILTPIGEP